MFFEVVQRPVGQSAILTYFLKCLEISRPIINIIHVQVQIYFVAKKHCLRNR